jgi:hypothetical protein
LVREIPAGDGKIANLFLQCDIIGERPGSVDVYLVEVDSLCVTEEIKSLTRKYKDDVLYSS